MRGNVPRIPDGTGPAEPLIELRQYTLHPGQRDSLIDLFDRAFIESQEAEGMSVIGQFRDIDDPDRFVWLRGFPDLDARGRGLERFYGGPVWAQHRQAANDTMIDSSNVLLLKQARSESGFAIGHMDRVPLNLDHAPKGLVMAGICSIDVGAEQAFVNHFEREVTPGLQGWGAVILGYFLSDHSANNFPRLPIRENENVFVWLTGFGARTSVAQMPGGRDRFEVAVSGAPGVNQPVEVLRLVPTARSLLTGASPPCASAAAASAREYRATSSASDQVRRGDRHR